MKSLRQDAQAGDGIALEIADKHEFYEKLRILILHRSPQPSERVVFTQDMNGSSGGHQETSLKPEESRAGNGFEICQTVAGRDGGTMGSMRNWMLGAAMLAGAAGLGSIPAQAVEFGIYVGGPAYVPPCPGPGYVWVAGYRSGGYWYPGRWNFVGYGGRDRYEYRDYGRDYRGRDFDRDRGWDRDRDRGRDWDRDRDRDHDRYRR